MRSGQSNSMSFPSHAIQPSRSTDSSVSSSSCCSSPIPWAAGTSGPPRLNLSTQPPLPPPCTDTTPVPGTPPTSATPTTPPTPKLHAVRCAPENCQHDDAFELPYTVVETVNDAEQDLELSLFTNSDNKSSDGEEYLPHVVPQPSISRFPSKDSDSDVDVAASAA